MSETVITVSNVRRVYKTEVGMFKKTKKEVEALKGISFSIHKGEIFGLLGPNGAGKSTMIKLLTTMLIPDSGTISILGMDPVTQHMKVRPHINFILGGERNLYWRLSAYDNLAYFADLYKVPRQEQKNRILELLELVGLENVAHQRVETFSKGMKQRLQIARGLINRPHILFLDEPSIGLDPVSARKLRDILLKLNEQGTTILLTTHYMYEADELCDRIAFIDKGELITVDTPENMKRQTAGVSIIECKLTGVNASVIEELSRLPHVRHMKHEQDDIMTTVRLQTEMPQAVIPEIYKLVDEMSISDLAIMQPSLEDVYVQLVGGNVQ